MGSSCGFSLRPVVRAIAAVYLLEIALFFGIFLGKQIVRMCNAPDNDAIKTESALISVPLAFIMALNYGLYSGATELRASGCKVWLMFQSWLVLIITVNSIAPIIHDSIWNQLDTLITLGINALLWIVVFMFIRELKEEVYLPNQNPKV